jgi:hypothetical protein
MEHTRKKNAWLVNETRYTFFEMGCMKLKNQMDRCGGLMNLQIL